MIIIVFLGLVVRLLLISLPGFAYDVGDWFAWSVRLDQIGLSNFYSDKIFSDYPPGYLYVLKFFGYFKSAYQIPDQAFYEYLKLPAIFSELGIGVLIYMIVKQIRGEKKALFASALFIFNPAIIFNSAIWGQIDGVLTLFLLAAIYLLQRNSYIYSSILFSTAFLIKPQAISIAPIFLLYLIRKFSFNNLMRITLPGLFVLLTVSFPFFPNNPVNGLFRKVLQTAGEYPYTSLNAYNFWGIVGFWVSDLTVWNGLTYQTWGYLLFGLYWLMIGYFYFKKRLSIYQLATLAALSFFFLPTKVHERYLYPALAFLVIVAFEVKSRTLIALTTILSLLHFANLYFVYIYYNTMELHFSDALYVQPIYNFLAGQPAVMSTVALELFVLISIIIIKANDRHQKNPV